MSRKKELDPNMINTIDYNGFKANAWYDRDSEKWSVSVTYRVNSLDFETSSSNKVFATFRSRTDELVELSHLLFTEDTISNIENTAFKLYNVYDAASNELVMTATRMFVQYVFDVNKATFRSKLNSDTYFKSLEGNRYYVTPRESMRLYEIHRGNINGYKREVRDIEVFSPLPPSLSERLATLTPILGELQNEK